MTLDLDTDVYIVVMFGASSVMYFTDCEMKHEDGNLIVFDAKTGGCVYVAAHGKYSFAARAIGSEQRDSFARNLVKASEAVLERRSCSDEWENPAQL